MAKTVKFTYMEKMVAHKVACPTCGVQPTSRSVGWCRTKTGTATETSHVARLMAARAVLVAEAAAKVAATEARSKAMQAEHAAAWAEVDARIDQQMKAHKAKEAQ